MIELQRVAVTGAGGFIGSAVCRALSRLGCEVHALVGPPGEQISSPGNLARDVRAIITDRSVLLSLFNGVDAVIHLAGPPSVRASFTAPVEFVNAHTGGTAAVLDACREVGVKQIVYVSSAEVYGRPETDPVDESHRLEARSPYAAAKIGAEQMVRAFDYACQRGTTIVRPFSVYGAGMGQHALIPAIFKQLDNIGSLRLADLRPVRDYCHVDDVARAIVAAAHVPRRATVAINIGSGVGTSVLSLAQLAVQITGTARAVEEDHDARRPGNSEILRLVADRRLALRELGWEPRIALEAGLRDMLSTSIAVK